MNRRPGLYALLLKAYPRDYTAAHGGEVLATLEESSGGRVVPREAAGLLLGALRQRRLDDRVRPRRAALVTAAWLGALLVLGLEFAVGTAVAVADLRDGGGGDPGHLLGAALSGAGLALTLRGRLRTALAVVLLKAVFLAFSPYESLTLSASLIVPVIVLAVMVARPSVTVSPRSWWWLAVPAVWGAVLMLGSTSATWLQVATVVVVVVVAGCEARFALAAAGVFLVMAADVLLSALALSSGIFRSELEAVAVLVGIALFLALLAGPAFTRSLAPTRPTA